MIISEYDITLRLLISGILGGIIGFERQILDRPAGFRTHVLVCIGSALVMLVSQFGFTEFIYVQKDPARIAAQVISGIGFLGAGTILRDGSTVRGLTTAASLWVVAGIGLAVGAGMFFAAIITTVFVYVVLGIFRKLETTFKTIQRFKLITADEPGLTARLSEFFCLYDVKINHINKIESKEDSVIIDVSLKIPAKFNSIRLISELSALPWVRMVEKL